MKFVLRKMLIRRQYGVITKAHILKPLHKKKFLFFRIAHRNRFAGQNVPGLVLF